MPRIFISYRRDDSVDVTGRIYDRLEAHFGRDNVFIDVDTIPFGVDFRKHIAQAVGQCDILLAVIGERWLGLTYKEGPRQGQRRLDDPGDFVRLEIRAALERDIPVIPVLVGRGTMPGEQELPDTLKELAFRNAAEVRSGRDFHTHTDRLVRGIERLLEGGRQPQEQPPSEPPPAAGRLALISDIHGNLEALQAVLRDVHKHEAERIYCLGDVVGYGPNPCECLDLVREYQVVLLGDHDQALMFDPEGFDPAAERAIFWTRAQLEDVRDGGARSERLWGFLAERPRSHKEDSLLFVHGSPRNPINEAVLPEDIYNERKMGRLFELVESACFQGHTHIPGIFTEDRRFFAPEEVGGGYRLGSGKVMCNVGSVGQPRDGDWRACYALLEGDLIRFCRVEYDVATTRRKVHAIPELDNDLGDRLREGR